MVSSQISIPAKSPKQYPTRMSPRQNRKVS